MTFLCGKVIEDLCRIKQVCSYGFNSCRGYRLTRTVAYLTCCNDSFHCNCVAWNNPVSCLFKVDLDSRHMGWVTSELPGGDYHVIKVELKGPENTLRVRQVKVLGWKDGESIKILGQISASMAQQKNCEAETLRVFRLITSQVCLHMFNSYLFSSIMYPQITHLVTQIEALLNIALCSTVYCSYRSLENLFAVMQNQHQSRRRKPCFPLLKEKTRSAEHFAAVDALPD